MDLLRTAPRRKVLFTALYLSEGAPIGFIWWALPTRLRADGVPLEEISLIVSLLAIPWALKFLWAPFVDIVRTSRWGIRSWILASQGVMGLTLLPLVWIDPAGDFLVILGFLMVHAFAAATQDASIDALCIASTDNRERGSLNGWMQVGMLGGRSLFGGGTLALASQVGDAGIVIALVCAVWISSILVLMSVEPARTHTAPVRERSRVFLGRLNRLRKEPRLWLGLLFAGLAGAAYEGVGSIAGPYLIDQGFPEETVGFFFLLPSVLAMVTGALIGGYAADRLNRGRAVALFLSAFVLCVAVLAIVDLLRDVPQDPVILVCLASMYLAIGLFTASSYALFMDITDPDLGATQFSAYMGGTNGCESWSAFAVGRLASAFGYPPAFLALCGASLLALPLLRKLEPLAVPENVNAVSE